LIEVDVPPDLEAEQAETERLPTVAILGLTASGKTVLAATLARRLRSENATGVVLLPEDPGTLNYVERVWQELNAGIWPRTSYEINEKQPSSRQSDGELGDGSAPTEFDSMAELRWTMVVNGLHRSFVRLVDIAGQDFSRVFDGKNYSNLPALEHVRNYCFSADVILFLINLRDYIGQGNSARAEQAQATMIGAINALVDHDPSRAVALVLTQANQYQPLTGAVPDWHGLLRSALPYVHQAYCVQRPLPLFPVTAVTDVTVRLGYGKLERVPVSNFGSAGIQPLVRWLANEVTKRASAPRVRKRTRLVLAIAGGFFLGAVLLAFLVKGSA
jgi:hypothetical protein